MKKRSIEVYVRHYTDKILDKHGQDTIISPNRYDKRVSQGQSSVGVYVRAILTYEVPEKIITITETQFKEYLAKAKVVPDAYVKCDTIDADEFIEMVMQHAKFEAPTEQEKYPNGKHPCPECQDNPSYIAMYNWDEGGAKCKSCGGAK